MQIRRLAELGATTHQRLMQRSTADVQRVLPQVQAIMEGVREREDAAVEEFTHVSIVSHVQKASALLLITAAIRALRRSSAIAR